MLGISSYVTQRIPYLDHSGFLTVLLSDETTVTFGVPHGSVLELVLFNVYYSSHRVLFCR